MTEVELVETFLNVTRGIGHSDTLTEVELVETLISATARIGHFDKLNVQY